MKNIREASDLTHELYEIASSARENAYSPYSEKKVGAAIRTSDGQMYSGCNVENSSYGATNCAERSAIFRAVSENGPIKIKEVLVVTDATPAWPPCGVCRQVIAEFAENPDIKIYCVNLKGEARSFTFKEIMPHAFTPSHLDK